MPVVELVVAGKTPLSTPENWRVQFDGLVPKYRRKGNSSQHGDAELRSRREFCIHSYLIMQGLGFQ
jgi:hypothetical protein